MRSSSTVLDLGAIRVPGRRQVDRAVVTGSAVDERLGLIKISGGRISTRSPICPRALRTGAGIRLSPATWPAWNWATSGPASSRNHLEQRAIDMRLWEISENLDRAELSALERAEQIAEWVRLTEGRRAEERVSVQIAQKVKTGRPEGGISAASRALGVTRDEVQRAVKRGAIVPEVKEAIRGNPTIADSGVELDALASMPAEEQQAAVAAVKGGKAATVREAAAKVRPRIAAENPDAPRRARGTATPAEPDSVDRIMAQVKDLSAGDFDRLKARFREFCRGSCSDG